MSSKKIVDAVFDCATKPWSHPVLFKIVPYGVGSILQQYPQLLFQKIYENDVDTLDLLCAKHLREYIRKNINSVTFEERNVLKHHANTPWVVQGIDHYINAVGLKIPKSSKKQLEVKDFWEWSQGVPCFRRSFFFPKYFNIFKYNFSDSFYIVSVVYKKEDPTHLSKVNEIDSKLLLRLDFVTRSDFWRTGVPFFARLGDTMKCTIDRNKSDYFISSKKQDEFERFGWKLYDINQIVLPQEQEKELTYGISSHTVLKVINSLKES